MNTLLVICYVVVPANLTNLFQPLDLTVNKAAKVFTRYQYSEFYRLEVEKQLSNSVSPHDVDVKRKLTTLKSIHAGWIVQMYENFKTEKGKSIILNGFRKSGITEALGMINVELGPFL